MSNVQDLIRTFESSKIPYEVVVCEDSNDLRSVMDSIAGFGRTYLVLSETSELIGLRLDIFPMRIYLRKAQKIARTLNQIHSCLKGLVTLQALDISFDVHTSLPDWLQNLTNLQRLNVSRNRLTELPDWLQNLTNLQSFNVSSAV